MTENTLAEKRADDNDGSDEDSGLELTPQQTGDFRRTLLGIQRAVDAQASRSTLTLPTSTIKMITAASGILDARREMIANSFQAMLGAQTAWQETIGKNLTSDTLRNIAQIQVRFAEVAHELTKGIDFRSVELATRIADSIAKQQSVWIENLGPALAAMQASFYPPNLRPIKGLKFEDVEQVVMADGIPLYGVPRASTAEALIRADGRRERRRILRRRWKSISADCRTAVEGCASASIAPYIPFAVAALDALDAGHTEAAQALAGSLVDTIVTEYFGKDRPKYTPHPAGTRTTGAYYELTIRQLVAFAPIWQAYQQFFVTNGDKVPATFSRHATAHAVSSRQYRRRNAVQGIMLACSLLCRLDEEAAVQEAA